MNTFRDASPRTIEKHINRIIESSDYETGEEHLIKPDIRIYQTLLNRYHLKADECLFIDDSLANLEGAKQAGLSVWHIPTSVA